MNVTIVSASAGSGKTYTLAERVAQFIAQGMEPWRVMATSFTNKAADELSQRVRARLLAEGNARAAATIRDGYIGTVNGVLGRLLAEFAWDVGLSPELTVVEPEEALQWFQRALSDAVARHGPDFDQACRRLGLEDWPALAHRIVDAARVNAVRPEALAEHGQRSWRSLRALFPDPSQESPERLNLWLVTAVDRACAGLSQCVRKKMDDKALDDLLAARRVLQRSHAVPWSLWAKLSKIEASVANRPVVELVKQVAALHPQHPGLHADLQRVVAEMMEVATEAMQTFAALKREKGVIDFVDQEALAYELLCRPDVAARIAERIGVVLVDEFQDCSPLELALILKLAEVVPTSVWVGDQKQAIYGFRGTDPELMDLVIRQIAAGHYDILSRSWRARPQLVEFTNQVFAPVFARHQMEAERVTLDPARAETANMAPALWAWWHAGNSKGQRTQALAQAVRETLARSQDYQVVDSRGAGGLRPVQGRDIAILCRTREACSEVAQALDQVGIPAAIGRGGLLQTREVVLALAAFRYLGNPQDRLALAELLHLSPGPWRDGRWLSEWLNSEGVDRLVSQPAVARLDHCRPQTLSMHVGEILECALSAADVTATVRIWGDSERRLGNLDRLRGIMTAYMEDCAKHRSATSVTGFLAYLTVVAERDRSRHLGADALTGQARTLDQRAVQVMTYHQSKGLEWPVVVLESLDWKREADVFGIHMMSTAEGMRADQLLEGRWIRFWPWPYGAQRRHVGLDTIAKASAEYRLVAAAAQAEAVRLFYVGATRARDYLVFSAGSQLHGLHALELLTDSFDRPALEVPLPDTGTNLFRGGSRYFPGAVSQWDEDGPGVVDREQETTVYGPPPHPLPPRRFAPRHWVPSHRTTAGSGVLVTGATLGGRLALVGNPDMTTLGMALHAFFAAAPTMADTVGLARQVLGTWHIAELSPRQLEMAWYRLVAWLDGRYPQRQIATEWPVRAWRGGQRMQGRIDWLMDVGGGYVIVDHKAFAGSAPTWQGMAEAHVGQLMSYAEVVTRATGRPVLATWLHLPVVGELLEVQGGGAIVGNLGAAEDA